MTATHGIGLLVRLDRGHRLVPMRVEALARGRVHLGNASALEGAAQLTLRSTRRLRAARRGSRLRRPARPRGCPSPGAGPRRCARRRTCAPARCRPAPACARSRHRPARAARRRAARRALPAPRRAARRASGCFPGREEEVSGNPSSGWFFGSDIGRKGASVNAVYWARAAHFNAAGALFSPPPSRTWMEGLAIGIIPL